MRVRFTITSDRWEQAKEYAKATNRTTSELINEALEQIQARYSKRHRSPAESELDALSVLVADRLSRVPAGTYKGKYGGL
jgi:predicted RNA-binding protein with PIN domain